ncbi:MAG: sulfotransferase family protein [Planctomycetaceae bacterium]
MTTTTTSATAGIASDPIVLFGAPRSGTTFLNHLFNAHPEVHVTHEMRLFAWAHHALHEASREDRLLVTHRREFIDHATRHFATLIRDFYAAQWPHVRYWGDKNPHYADVLNRGCLDTIRRIFPGAKFVHIVRDGRDVVASIVRRQHADGRSWASIEDAAWTWRDHAAIGAAFGRKIGAAHYHEVLVADGLRNARELFGFLGIPLHPAVEHFCLTEQEKRSAFSSPTRDLAAGDATRSDWGRVFSDEDRALAMHILEPKLVEFGYAVAMERRP